MGKAEVVALVGESGSGKTTISRCVGGLHKEWTGSIDFEGNQLGHGSRKRSVEDRKRIQYIFQNPYLSLNPRLTIEQIVKRPMELFGIASGKAATERVVELLDQVALGPAVLKYQASRLSGGERQRVAIARALAAEPDVLVCDEITSALDVSVQGSIVALLESLRVSRGISMLFVTHNLALVRSIADRVQILNAGRVVESGSVVAGDGRPRRRTTPSGCSRTVRESTDGPPRTTWRPGDLGLSTMAFIDPQNDAGRPPRRDPRLPAAAPRRASSRPLTAQIPGAGRTRDLDAWVSETHTTALLVLDGPLRPGLRRARVVRRRRSTPSRLLLGASMTKSVLAHLVGNAIASGAMRLEDAVTQHVPDKFRWPPAGGSQVAERCAGHFCPSRGRPDGRPPDASSVVIPTRT